MLNEELIDNKTKEIISLRCQIKRFKKYDKERSEYYKSSLIKLGECESLVSEYEDFLINILPILRSSLSKINKSIKKLNECKDRVKSKVEPSSDKDRLLNYQNSTLTALFNLQIKINSIITKLDERIQTKSISWKNVDSKRRVF